MIHSMAVTRDHFVNTFLTHLTFDQKLLPLLYLHMRPLKPFVKFTPHHIIPPETESLLREQKKKPNVI